VVEEGITMVEIYLPELNKYESNTAAIVVAMLAVVTLLSFVLKKDG
jgi:hypothetical protein